VQVLVHVHVLYKESDKTISDGKGIRLLYVASINDVKITEKIRFFVDDQLQCTKSHLSLTVREEKVVANVLAIPAVMNHSVDYDDVCKYADHHHHYAILCSFFMLALVLI